MKVGVPSEIKTDEYRVALTPAGVRELVEHDHDVVIQAGAGEGSAISDDDYRSQGARILSDVEAVFGEADMIVKVKEPQPVEVGMLESRHLLGLGLLDLDDHLRLAEHGVGIREDPGPLRAVVLVRDRGPVAGARLDHDLMAVLDQFAHPGRRERHSVLVGLDLGGNANDHAVPFVSSRPRRASQKSMRSRAESSERPVSSSTRRIR